MRIKALALLLQVGLMAVQILVAAMMDKNGWSIGKPSALNPVPYDPQYIDGWKITEQLYVAVECCSILAAASYYVF